MSKKPNRVRTTQTNVRLTETEKQIIDTVKAEKDLTLTELILEGIKAMQELKQLKDALTK